MEIVNTNRGDDGDFYFLLLLLLRGEFVRQIGLIVRRVALGGVVWCGSGESCCAVFVLLVCVRVCASSV